MTSVLAKYISKKILGEHAGNNFGREDPYFETVPATRLNGRHWGKRQKKTRKALPAGISEHDGKVLTKVKRRAYRLDVGLFSFCGIRLGWSSVIGLFPLFGDFIDLFMALMVLRTCEKIEGGLPNDVRFKMVVNICLDFGIRLVPFVGDVIDTFFRCNTRNAIVLERLLKKKGALNLKKQGYAEPIVDPTDPDEYDKHIEEALGPAPPYEHVFAEGPTEASVRSDRPTQETTTAQPKPSHGWFSRFRSQTPQPDVEKGTRTQTRVQTREATLPNLPPRLPASSNRH